MKTKFTLLLILVAAFMLTVGQSTSFHLTFTAIDSAAYVRLDSVQIMNRTQGGGTTIYWPDTSVSLEITPGDLLLYIGYATPAFVGISGSGTVMNSFQLFQNYPNPVTDQTVISMYIPEKGTVKIMVTDVQGRVVLASDRQLDQGTHSFRFLPGGGGLFFFTARWNEVSRSIKILTSETLIGQMCRLDYLESSTNAYALKASLQTGSTVIQKSGILDGPETDRTYVFQFASNIPCPEKTSVSYAGKIYSTLQIFSQCWLKENLNVGTMISGTIDQSNNGTMEKYCYGDMESNCDTYGGLYQWNEAMQYSSEALTKGICPPGWRLPMDEEWKVLEGAVDGQYGFGNMEWDGEGYRGYNVGSGLKEAGTTHWNPPNYGATNSSGFTGLPAGNRDYSTGGFANMGAGGSFWSSSEDGTGNAWYRALNYASPHAYRKYVDKAAGYSVRCLRGCAPVKAYAGENDGSCGDAAYSLSGATAANFATLLWTTSGTGTFDDPTRVNPMYTPSLEDMDSGQVELTLAASGGGECPDAASTMTLTFTAAPEANAGDDADICSTQYSLNLNGVAANYSSALWTTSGTGTFNDPSSLTAVYTPSTGDKMNGPVILSLNVNGNGPCEPVSDAMTLKIWTGTANAGPDQLNIHGNSTTLAGNAPTFGNGLWQIVSGSGGNVYDPDDPHSIFNGLYEHAYTLTWTISNTVCGTSVDTVEISFAPEWSCGEPIVDDRDGQSYNTVLIGDQCWLAENMNIGTMITNGPGVLQTNNGVIEKFCYDNISYNCDTYGGLYEWDEAMQYVTTESALGICPGGWHLASDDEWKILEGTVDSQFQVGDLEWEDIGWRGYDAGGNLKETGLAHWESPNDATNSSGFTAFGGGSRTTDDWLFWNLKVLGMFWTSTQIDESLAWPRGMRNDITSMWRYDERPKTYAQSIRCLMND
ncbi:MAG TPA: FISUMP domain-containing protein [Bacteroidales bacterium]|nr:FISUMP domain-containing protein [Bacteroidales bacterium]